MLKILTAIAISLTAGIGAGLIMVGGWPLIIGLTAFALAATHASVFAAGIVTARAMFRDGAEAATRAAASNDEHDAQKIRAFGGVMSEAIKLQRHLGAMPQQKSAPLLPAGAPSINYVIEGLEPSYEPWPENGA